MSAGTVMREHEAEPVPGLPERLPAGERLLWQGAPTWRGLARHAFRTRIVAGYFGVLVGWRVAVVLADGAGVAEALVAGLWIAGLGAAAVGVLSALAWLMARSTLYTITDRRLVMRFGVALPMTINVPFALVQGASVRRRRDGGDISLEIARPNKISYLVLWPNVRPWHMAAPQPTLRALAASPKAGRFAKVAEHPVVARVLELFPGARIEEVTAPPPEVADVPDDDEMPDVDTVAFDDDTPAGKANQA